MLGVNSILLPEWKSHLLFVMFKVLTLTSLSCFMNSISHYNVLCSERNYSPFLQDEKDKRIRELSLELYNERQKCKRKCAAYEAQLNMILKDLEKHTEHISKKVADIVQSIKDIEDEQLDSDSG